MTSTHELPYTVASVDPLIVLASNGSTAPSHLGQSLADDFPETRFVVVLSAVDAAGDADVIASLAPCAAEFIFTAPDVVPADDEPSDRAFAALDSHALGQDFVYMVPRVQDAIDYAVTAIGDADFAWEGKAVAVVGDSVSLQLARQTFAPRR